MRLTQPFTLSFRKILFPMIATCMIGSAHANNEVRIFIDQLDNATLTDKIYTCSKADGNNESWQLNNCRVEQNDDSVLLKSNELIIKNGDFLTNSNAVIFPLGGETIKINVSELTPPDLSCEILAKFQDNPNGIAIKKCSTVRIVNVEDKSPSPNASCAGIQDQISQNPFKACNDLTIANESNFKQSEYPGCMGKPDVFPTQCRGDAAIVGQHTYAQRFDFQGWTKDQGFCEGTEKSRVTIYATTNDAMNTSAPNYENFGTLDMAISEIPGDLNPSDSACRWNGEPAFTVSVAITQAGTQANTCKLTPGKKYYINVKPFGKNTTQCSATNGNCRFSLYTNAVPVKSTNCVSPSSN